MLKVQHRWAYNSVTGCNDGFLLPCNRLVTSRRPQRGNLRRRLFTACQHSSGQDLALVGRTMIRMLAPSHRIAFHLCVSAEQGGSSLA